MNSAAIEQEALHLNPVDRARLAHNLLLSLESVSMDEPDTALLDLAEQRATQIDQGVVQLVSAEEVSMKARSLLR